MSAQLRGLAWIAVLMLALPAAAQETQPIVLTVLSAEMEDIDDPLLIHLRIDSKLPDLIYRTEMRVPEELIRDRDIPFLRTTDPEPLIGSPWFRDYKNDTVTVRLPAAKGRNLFYRSKKLNGSVTLIFVAAGFTNEVSTAPVAFTVKPRGHLLGVIIGGILGVIAVVVLRSAVRAGRGGKQRVNRAYWKTAGTRILVGAIVVTILTFIVRENPGQLDLPIKVDVADWVGGFFLGLFFEPLAKWLTEKIPGLGEDT